MHRSDLWEMQRLTPNYTRLNIIILSSVRIEDKVKSNDIYQVQLFKAERAIRALSSRNAMVEAEVVAMQAMLR